MDLDRARMAELFMECEEEELAPWQKGNKDDEDDDDDEPIFVGEITSSKNTSYLSKTGGTTFHLAQRGGMQNGGLSKSMMVSFSSAPGTSSTIQSVNQQSITSSPSISSTMAAYQPGSQSMPVSLTLQPVVLLQGFIVKDMGSLTSAPQSSGGMMFNVKNAHYQSKPSVPVLSGVASLSGRTGVSQLKSVGTGRAIPNISYNPIQINSSVPSASVSGQKLGQQNTVKPLQATQILNHASGKASAAQSTNVSNKRPAACEINNIGSKKSKKIETGSGNKTSSLSPSSTGCPTKVSSYTSTSKGSPSNIKNGVPVPRACPKCNIHFNVLDSLRHHMVFCCPDLVSSYCTVSSAEKTPTKVLEIEKGKLIMLVNDFYYGKDDGDAHLNQKDKKTNTTFKCYSCLKILKSNIRFMNHMKHHMELEKQSSESWESHTTCQHCHRQFPTPFQLQCHIETAHCPYESTTICKICELSYESEQILLQHMKDNHKPGEMPYVCQVCSFRSSVFSDVDSHFRIVHENTKQLLCPFCLKVIKIGNAYVQHYLKHQKKGVYRCGKCKLQFLTCKEKVDHKTQHHRTFRKPPQLEGLPPGTKVTIRASMTPYPVGSSSSSQPSVNSAASSTLQCSSSVTVNTKLYSSTINKVTTIGSSQQLPYIKEEKKKNQANEKVTKPFNIDLQFSRASCDIHKCIECDTEIEEFASHFATYTRCPLCRFRSSCNKSYVAHVMSSHTVPCKKNFWMFKEYSNKLSDIKLVCSSCPFEATVSDSDDMAKHLYQNKFHVCHIVSKSSASSIIDNIVQRSEQISTLDEIKTEANPSSALLATETLEVDLTADGNQEKTDQPLMYKAENPSVEAVPSPKGDKLSDQQDKTNSNDNVESNQSTENTADGPLSELTTEKDYDAGERVQDNSSKQALTPPDTNEAQDLKSVDNDVEIVQDEFEGIDTCDEPKDCKTLPDLILKCKQTGNEGIDNEKCTEEKSNDANVEQNKDPKEDVCFDQFFRSKDEPEAVGSDVSEQGSIQLEPLTPSEVLEHEATEILQKGSVVTVTKRKGTASTEENNKETTPAPILLSSEHLEENEKS
ncbi:zinc finger protein 280D isoform X3 [Amblyraja radiata]|uniref:zinc finger protein 280D isoform X3 n=1 Tax=Amblyraja radiata TaxID=386614 RepID=UPI001403889A|nr:zinc finger protein 280D isoform X3 [Amblyraja radiata]